MGVILAVKSVVFVVACFAVTVFESITPQHLRVFWFLDKPTNLVDTRSSRLSCSSRFTLGIKRYQNYTVCSLCIVICTYDSRNLNHDGWRLSLMKSHLCEDALATYVAIVISCWVGWVFFFTSPEYCWASQVYLYFPHSLYNGRLHTERPFLHILGLIWMAYHHIRWFSKLKLERRHL